MQVVAYIAYSHTLPEIRLFFLFNTAERGGKDAIDRIVTMVKDSRCCVSLVNSHAYQ
jgi:hypothetical protein